MSRPYQVKGSSISSKLAYLHETRGEAAEGEARVFLKERGITTVLEATWYDYDIYDRLLVWIARRHFGGDVSKLTEVGQYSAQKALTTTYEAFRRSGDFGRFLEKLPILHKRYYSHGQLVASLVLPGASGCEVLLDGAPTYSDSDLYVACGFYSGAAELMGHRDVTCHFLREGKRVRLKLQWRV
ncbi:MAG: hypothetical protein AAFY88_00350 [Acidobacteriota bacterium]